ncbi:hypothetical protein SAMN05443633_102185 [Chryseobacterium arachidis]|uniref:Uncharacterized protein n=1 Tax=Chryseobacterium arachidis TaxID=1416778 RepID=A0A1M4WZS6_9FLAO|nr:hypothetical protein [Chryseobacterium arachidis]SHE86766.1 hypothetical protein SAMN05443633_102185 [Chryseobacterium arachidis]
METTINESIEKVEVPLTAIANEKGNTINHFEVTKNIEKKDTKETDFMIYRIIVIMLGFAVISIIIALFVLSLRDKGTDNNQLITIFATISSGAIGALAGLLTPSPKK